MAPPSTAADRGSVAAGQNACNGAVRQGRPFALEFRVAIAARRIAACLLLLLPFMAFAPTKGFARETWPTPENPVDFLRVVKSKRTLEAWRDDRIVRRFKISLGARPQGHKQQEGDERTPEGWYTLDYRKSDSVAYKAFHISYPSAEDRARARAAGVRPGGSIMIHGQWDGFGWLGFVIQNYDWTDGCIGLRNEDIDALWQMVGWNTPIQIVP
jgi:murein L,D-transpeptidase YafK